MVGSYLEQLKHPHDLQTKDRAFSSICEGSHFHSENGPCVQAECLKSREKGIFQWTLHVDTFNGYLHVSLQRQTAWGADYCPKRTDPTVQSLPLCTEKHHCSAAPHRRTEQCITSKPIHSHCF